MGEVIKNKSKTLSLKNPPVGSLTKIIKEKLDIDINNIKGSDIPKLFKKGLKFKGILGKRVVDGISSFIKKNPNTKKQYEKFLPESLKKGIKKDKKISTNTIPKKIKKIDISNIMKNPRTGRGQNLPTRVTDKNKNTGTNLTKRVLEGEVIQGIKKPQSNPKVNNQTIDGKFQNISPKSNQIGNQNKLNISGLKRKGFLSVDKDFPFKKKDAIGEEKIKKVKPPKDFNPKIKTPKTSKVIKKELPKVKSNDYTGRFIDKKGDVAYDSPSDFLAHMFGTPKKRAMPKKTARILGGTGNKLKRKEADTKGAGKGVKFKAFKSGTKDKTIGKPKSYKKALMETYKNKSDIYGRINTPIGQKSKRKRTMIEKIFGGGPNENWNRKINEAKKAGKKEAGYRMWKEYPELMERAKKETTVKKSGGGLIAGLYDKPEKTEKYKGNSTSARQVKGYGKARKP